MSLWRRSLGLLPGECFNRCHDGVFPTGASPPVVSMESDGVGGDVVWTTIHGGAQLFLAPRIAADVGFSPVQPQQRFSRTEGAKSGSSGNYGGAMSLSCMLRMLFFDSARVCILPDVASLGVAPLRFRKERTSSRKPTCEYKQRSFFTVSPVRIKPPEFFERFMSHTNHRASPFVRAPHVAMVNRTW